MPVTPSNFTALNTTNWGAWLSAVNTLSGNWIGAIIMLIVFLGTLITLRAGPLSRTCECFAVAGFVTWIIGTLLLTMRFVSVTVWAASLSLMILGGIWVWLEG